MNPAIEQLIAIAKKEVGTREGPLNNTGARIVEYQGATWLAPGAWPWCAAFCCWIMRELLEDSSVRQGIAAYFKRPSLTFGEADKYRCRDASAFGWEKWAKQHGFRVLDEHQLARAGDFVVFDFSHIGLVTENQPSLATTIKTIEGNTNGKGERDSASGDGVWVKERERSLTKSYIRIFSD
ncbi:MAG TPA: CHAP domain-containing protein [Methylibium sp.]|uniref:CHAP domain-containing protein n=1 Tax=Methylibium sp. TaxID=2067992 RepID=UPI002DBFE275|nr:CHAP domain-containing protein [Methylibium sp.]HEU4458223.1 CHAP domain-containing protein [Methylibium sp.]